MHLLVLFLVWFALGDHGLRVMHWVAFWFILHSWLGSVYRSGGRLLCLVYLNAGTMIQLAVLTLAYSLASMEYHYCPLKWHSSNVA